VSIAIFSAAACISRRRCKVRGFRTGAFISVSSAR
jgi:hypothetical protein